MAGTRRAGAVVALAVGLGLGAGCSSAPETGAVRGRLVMAGGFTDRVSPVSGMVTIERSNGKATRVRARRVGGFTATVPVGRVHLTGRSQSFSGGDGLCGARHPVNVRSDATATVDVVCFMR